MRNICVQRDLLWHRAEYKVLQVNEGRDPKGSSSLIHRIRQRLSPGEVFLHSLEFRWAELMPSLLSRKRKQEERQRSAVRRAEP